MDKQEKTPEATQKITRLICIHSLQFVGLNGAIDKGYLVGEELEALWGFDK